MRLSQFTRLCFWEETILVKKRSAAPYEMLDRRWSLGAEHLGSFVVRHANSQPGIPSNSEMHARQLRYALHSYTAYLSTTVFYGTLNVCMACLLHRLQGRSRIERLKMV